MHRVGRPRTRPEANLNVNFEHRRGSEQGIDMEAESHPNSPRPQPRALEPRDETIDRITQLLTTIVQHQTHFPNITIEHARRVGDTSFDGSGDPDSAYAWLNDLERIFEVMGCSDEQKFSFATFLLKDRAYDSWLSMKRKNPVEVSWNEFKRLFNAHFCPSFYQNLKMNEFYKLVHGSMTMDAYEKNFTELSRATPHIVENEVNRCKKFEESLKHEIKTYVSATEHTEYGKLVESTLRVERNINEAHRFDQQR
ncbi:hypothetical protein JRO89_XS06G0198700 [Xanthoceras sorbifolium]|uniref:Retrotransposon gag domain-containing protein n=1 Tax=Xanthoceras sorbifolium TaxID=99658 RepID=A0ABQ8HYZ9_9ROSI|nr:hypothetical protein JRO89_XS06G0198700 [Xanthoceras sorbifolium]